MGTEPEDIGVSLKALPIFSTMRSNLAMVLAFSRRSILEASNYRDEDLGFLGIRPGEEQMNIHNGNVITIQVALLYQALENYQELKKTKPTLEYRELEDFLKDLEGTGEFIDSMRIIRNGVFHVNTPKLRDRQCITSFNETCNEHGGVPTVMAELLNLLYDFTEKVFEGKLKIWPAAAYEDLDRLEKERPDLMAKLKIGEADLLEIVDAMYP